MFSKAIVGSARFLKMPTDSQTLYFHLGMATDDDGIVEAWSVLKTTGSAEDNLRVLATKGFIKILNEDLVSYLMDWNEHNELRADRITPSQYRELLIQMVPDAVVKEPKRRADLKPLLESGRPLDVQRTEEDRIGEDRILNTSVANAPPIERVSEDERPKRMPIAKYPDAKKVFRLFPVYVPALWDEHTTFLKAAQILHDTKGMEELTEMMAWYQKNRHREFCPQFDDPNECLKKYEPMSRFFDKITS